MKLFSRIGQVLFYLFIIIIMLQNCQCGTISEVEQTTRAPQIAPISRDIFLPDDFTLDQLQDIKDGLHEWEAKTNGSISFRIFEHYDKKFISLLTIRAFCVIILDSPADAPAIVDLDRRETKRKGTPTQVLGYYDYNNSIPTIYIVSSRIPNRTVYTAVIEHELGHSFGLDHNPKENTVMYESQDQSAKHIMPEDVENFCQLHICLARTK